MSTTTNATWLGQPAARHGRRPPGAITAGGIVLLDGRRCTLGRATYDGRVDRRGSGAAVRGTTPGSRCSAPPPSRGSRGRPGRRRPSIRATLDTGRSPSAPGGSVSADPVDRRARARRRRRAEPTLVRRAVGPNRGDARPFAAGDDVAVTLKRTAVPPTPDQALWVAIRNSTNALGFDNYSRFIDGVMCGELPGRRRPAFRRATRHDLRKVKRRTALPFPNVDRYRLLKAATEVFLMIHCGVDLDDFRRRRPGRGEPPARTGRCDPGDLEAQMRDYLVRVPDRRGRLPRRAALPRADPAQAARRPVVGDDEGDDEAPRSATGSSPRS